MSFGQSKIGDQVIIQLFHIQEILSAFSSFNIKCLLGLIQVWDDNDRLPCSSSLDMRTSIKHT